ncbi:MAG: hypothetical protein K1Y36_00550 [Blastocatellia bacterium]|nr:hypothetical protein [Blastocatellia bacterium]
MKNMLFSLFLAVGLASFSPTAPSVAAQNPAGQAAANKLVFKFKQDLQGWTGGFADYPPGQETFYELTAQSRPLPAEVGKNAKGFFISGNNHSDDLFMFLKRRVTGFKPNTTYRLQFKVKFATNAPANCVGIGGAPGESVYLKVGGATLEPQGEVQENLLVLNLDKGNQAQGGRNAVVAGNISGTNSNCAAPRFEFKVLKNTAPVEVTTAADGSFWLLVGTDSGFEGTTSLYYSAIQVQLVEK